MSRKPRKRLTNAENIKALLLETNKKFINCRYVSRKLGLNHNAVGAAFSILNRDGIIVKYNSTGTWIINQEKLRGI